MRPEALLSARGLFPNRCSWLVAEASADARKRSVKGSGESEPRGALGEPSGRAGDAGKFS